ncbi:MAG TPA: response regulator transcription factor [Cyclobacteriaceae bacterium]|nr:response regulator transcription factor [Cyclobacteriaceae bacterium]
MNKLKVYIVDDHTIFRKAMVSMLQGFDRVAEVKDAENGKEFLEIIKYDQPDVAIIDLQMPVMDGVETSKRILAKYPDIKIVILTMLDNEQYIIHMIEMGVHAFLLKNTDPDELEKAIYTVYDNDFYNNEIVAAALRKNIKAAAQSLQGRKVEFTEREKEIILLVCQDLTNKEIGEKLNISDRTVETHKSRIMDKIGAKSAIGIVKFAYDSKMIS